MRALWRAAFEMATPTFKIDQPDVGRAYSVQWLTVTTSIVVFSQSDIQSHSYP
jgi:hypothetical protein